MWTKKHEDQRCTRRFRPQLDAVRAQPAVQADDHASGLFLERTGQIAAWSRLNLGVGRHCGSTFFSSGERLIAVAHFSFSFWCAAAVGLLP